MNRGGTDQGDIPQCIEGATFLNTIGIALSVPISDPTKWSQREKDKAAAGELCFFKGDSLKAINVVAEKIYEECGGDRQNYITVLPVELLYKEKLYSLTIFRFKRYKDSSWKFVDNIGRVYSSFSDWKDNNKLPPGKVLYPRDGHLSRDSSGDVDTTYRDTPSASTLTTVAKVTDITAGVVGIGSAIGATFLSGGIALPFIIAGVASAGYSTARSGYQLYDRGSHSESINPIGDWESLSLWLGIGANIVSFGAMGATWRLSSIALKGKNISDGFKLFVNIMNGTSLTVNTVAMANSITFMIIHFEDMSPVDILLQVASIAFWAKSVYTFQSAGQIVKNMQNQALKGYSSGLSAEEQAKFEQLRQAGNDQQLVKFFYDNVKIGLEPTALCQVLLESNAYFQNNPTLFDFNPLTNTIVINGQAFTVQYLTQISSPARQMIFNVLGSLSPEQANSFSQMRQHVQNDPVLFTVIAATAHVKSVNPEIVTHALIDYWNALSAQPFEMPALALNAGEGTLVVGNGYKIPFGQLKQYTSQPRLMKLMSSQIFTLSGDDVKTFNLLQTKFQNDLRLLTWIDENNQTRNGNTVKLLLDVQRNVSVSFFGMITDFISNGIEGNGIVELSKQVKISIYSLHSLKPPVINEMCKMIISLKVESGKLVNFKQIKLFRIQPEFNRTQAVEWFKQEAAKYKYPLKAIGDIRPNDKNRLIGTTSALKHLPQALSDRIREFAFFMKPTSVSEFVSYNEFAYAYLSELKKEQPNQDGTNLKFDKMKDEFLKMKKIASDNKMFGMMKVPKNLSNDSLIAEITSRVKNNDSIRFGSEVSAAYHIYKRPGSDQTKFVVEANNVIKDTGNSKRVATVSLTQEGNARLVDIETDKGKVGLLVVNDRDGKNNDNVLLCTYIKKTK